MKVLQIDFVCTYVMSGCKKRKLMQAFQTLNITDLHVFHKWKGKIYIEKNNKSLIIIENSLKLKFSAMRVKHLTRDTPNIEVVSLVLILYMLVDVIAPILLNILRETFLMWTGFKERKQDAGRIYIFAFDLFYCS